MRYDEYDSDKTYVVMLCSGFGVMEAPYTDVRIVYETDDEEDANNTAKRLRIENNNPEQIASSWVPNTYWVYVNTKTDKGLAEYNKWKESITKTHPLDYTNELFGFKQPKVEALSSHSVVWIDTSKINNNG